MNLSTQIGATKKSLTLFAISLLCLITVSIASRQHFLNLNTSASTNAQSNGGQEKNSVEFSSNQILIKVKKDVRNNVKEGNPFDTGLPSLNKLHSDQPIKVRKFERVVKKGKKSKVDHDLFSWYVVTLDNTERKLKGEFDRAERLVQSSDQQVQGFNELLNKYRDDPNIEAAEPNFTVTLSQTPTATATATPTPDTTPPSAPTNLTASSITSTSVTLSWGASYDNDIIGAYNIYRNDQLIIQGNVLTYKDINLSPSTTYTYYIRAQDRAGNLSLPSNQVNVITLSAPTPIPIASHEPNDPYYVTGGTWGESYSDMWGLRKINIGDAWLQTTGSNTIVVADIDSGVDRNHEDLINNMWTNNAETLGNGVDDDGNGYVDDYYGWDFMNNDNDPMDDNGHGTHIAGTIAAVGNNSTGVVGINWNSKIMAVKMLGASGTGNGIAAIQALQYAADMGAKISSNSWGCNCVTTYWDDAVKYEHDRGMAVVAAAGNNNSDALDFAPASSERVITVGASDVNDNRSIFWSGYASNWGQKIDVVAPGSDILSTKSSYEACSIYTVGSSYCRKWGTSMAAPHVAGLAALLLARNPSLTNEEIRQVLRHSAVDLGAVGKDNDFGYGRINAATALQSANANVITSMITNLRNRDTVTNTTLTLMGTAAGAGFASYTIEVGVGRAPSAWTIMKTSTTPVKNGILADIDAGTYLASSSNTIRLTAFDTAGLPYQITVYEIKYMPAPATTPTSTPTPTIIPTTAPTNTPTPTFTPTPTNTPIPTPTNSPTPTLTPTPTDTTGPIVTITNPVNGSTPRVNSTITLSATASDPSGVARVEFYVNNVFLCNDTTASYTCSWRVPNRKNITYTITARAFDTKSNTAITSVTVRSR